MQTTQYGRNKSHLAQSNAPAEQNICRKTHPPHHAAQPEREISGRSFFAPKRQIYWMANRPKRSHNNDHLKPDEVSETLSGLFAADN